MISTRIAVFSSELGGEGGLRWKSDRFCAVLYHTVYGEFDMVCLGSGRL